MNPLNPLFLTPALSGSIFIIAGFVLLKFPPTKINGIYGYRTPRSMQSQEQWDFAQTYSAKQLIKYGFISVGCSVVGLFISVKEISAVGCRSFYHHSLCCYSYNKDREGTHNRI